MPQANSPHGVPLKQPRQRAIHPLPGAAADAVAAADALLVQTPIRPAFAAVPARVVAPRADAEGVVDADAAAVTEAAPAQAVDLDDGKFMRWYRNEKLREKYEEENPTDPFERIKGPAFSLAFILLGFNLGPIIGKIFEITGVTADSLPKLPFGGN